MKDSIKQLAQSVLRKYPPSPTESQAPRAHERAAKLDDVSASGRDRYTLWLERWDPPRSLRVQ